MGHSACTLPPTTTPKRHIAGYFLFSRLFLLIDGQQSSTLICGHLVAALRGTTDFRSADHSATMQSGKAELKKRNQVAHDDASDDSTPDDGE
jgi:hypothetical protein